MADATQIRQIDGVELRTRAWRLHAMLQAVGYFVESDNLKTRNIAVVLTGAATDLADAISIDVDDLLEGKAEVNLHV
jgi:hypothetical protein